MRGKGKTSAGVALLAACLFMVMMITSCGGGSSDTDTGGPFEGRETADLSAYEGMGDYEGDPRLVETDVAEAVQLMDDKESFVLFLSYASCPWCNCIIPYLNEAAEKAGTFVGYVDTRKDPSWMSNMDIENYDLFLERFGEYVDEDEEGKKHLYTPDLYFIKKGKVAAHHDGVLEGVSDPAQPLTTGQEEELRKILAEEFESTK